MAGTDRISNLPDEVLSEILARVPSKTAVGTSILSNRWKNVWRSVPTVDLDDAFHPPNDQDSKSDHRFSHFASSFILALIKDAATQPILNFRLKYKSPSYFNYSHLKLWVNTAIQRNVENIEISLLKTFQIKLPPSVVTCGTLVVLKLEILRVNLDDSNVWLPLLKTLHLHRVVFARREHLRMLLLGCPILEDLLIGSIVTWLSDGFEDDDDIPYIGALNNAFPKLVRADVSSVAFEITEFSNVEYLRLEYVYGTFATFRNLIHMELSMLNYKWCILVKLLGFCPLLQTLVINEASNIMCAFDLKDQPVPDCLVSRLRECTITNFQDDDGGVEFATYIMQNARVLLKMDISSSRFLNVETMFLILQDLSKVPRISSACELLFK